MYENQITQSELATALHVNQSTISRWFAHDGDLHFPAPFICMLDSDRMRPIAQAIIKYVLNKMNMEIVANGHSATAVR